MLRTFYWPKKIAELPLHIANVLTCHEYTCFYVEQLNCWRSEMDQNQEVDFEIGGSSGTKKVKGKFNIEYHVYGTLEILLCLEKLAPKNCWDLYIIMLPTDLQPLAQFKAVRPVLKPSSQFQSRPCQCT